MQTRRTALKAAVAFVTLAAAGLAANPALASLEEEAASFLTDVGKQAIQQLTDKSVAEQDRVDRFRDLMMGSVEFSLISQQVLGTYWRQADDATRQEFNLVLRESLIQRFMPLFDQYQGETFEVVSTRGSSKDPSIVAATTNLVAPNGNVARVEWYMKKFDYGIRIYDFSAEGVRLTISLQDEYDTVLRKSDGDVSALIDQMKQKLPATAKLQ